MQKIFIIHGWSGTPDANWFPWMKDQLIARNIKVEILHMPNTDIPQMDEWMRFMHEKIEKVNEDIFFVGHSLGCMAIMRYAESLTKGEKIGGALFVAGFSRSIGIPYIENFFITPLDYNKVQETIIQKKYIISDNDPYVPIAEGAFLKENLGGELIVLSDAGHINQSSGFVTFQVGLEELLQMMEKNDI